MVHFLPKAELHVHLEGTITPALVQRLATQKNIDVDKSIFTSDFTAFTWESFADFHKVFEESFKVITSAEDYAFITYLYLKQLAEQKCLYAELIAAPFHAEENSIGYEQMLRGLIAGITQAKAEFGIDGRILIAFLRHYGPQASEKYLQQMLSQRHPYVVGINLVGDIKQYEIKAFEKIFAQARANGLKASCHAGEIDGGPKEIWQAIEYLGAERISHGITCLADHKLVDTLIEKQITLEVCPTSNVILKMYSTYAEHPLKALKDAGVLLTLNTDDPGFFNVNLNHEYDIAQRHFNFSTEDLLASTTQAIKASFADQAMKDQLVASLNSSLSIGNNFLI